LEISFIKKPWNPGDESIYKLLYLYLYSAFELNNWQLATLKSGCKIASSLPSTTGFDFDQEKDEINLINPIKDRLSILGLKSRDFTQSRDPAKLHFDEFVGKIHVQKVLMLKSNNIDNSRQYLTKKICLKLGLSVPGLQFSSPG
jgi:hypothetical protein